MQFYHQQKKIGCIFFYVIIIPIFTQLFIQQCSYFTHCKIYAGNIGLYTIILITIFNFFFFNVIQPIFFLFYYFRYRYKLTIFNAIFVLLLVYSFIFNIFYILFRFKFESA